MHQSCESFHPCTHEPHVMHSWPISFLTPPLIDRHNPHGSFRNHTPLCLTHPSQAKLCNIAALALLNLRLFKPLQPVISVSKLPIFLHRFDCPIKLFPQCLGEELLNRHVKFLREDHRQTRIDVVLQASVSTIPNMLLGNHSQSWTCPEQPPCCFPCPWPGRACC